MDLNYKLLLKIAGLILAISGVGMVPSVFCALYYGENSCLKSFLICSLLFIALGLAIYRVFDSGRIMIRIRDGYITVAACWILSCVFGSIPYYFSGCDLSIVESLFEATAGYTTTGASTITGELVPKSLLLYRSVTHWLGGMGILVLAVSILPALGIGGQNLARAEMPSLRVDKVTTKISDSARILYVMYFGFTIIEYILLMFSKKMSAFDALVNTLSTISTGGLMTHTSGLAYYDSLYVEVVISLFSFLVAINFGLYYFAIQGKIREMASNAELKTFFIIIAAFTLAIACNLYSDGIYESFGESARYASGQVLSFATTSGFSFADFNSWPMFSKMLLFFLVLMGGCAASTSGGIKVIRIMILFGLIKRGFKTRVHPRSVVPVKISGEPLNSQVISQITSFILMYLVVFFAGCLLLSFDSTDIATNIYTTATTLSNTGINFGDFGDVGNYSIFSPFSQMVLSIMMIIGRLELYTIILLLSPAFWNPNRQKNL